MIYLKPYSIYVRGTISTEVSIGLYKGYKGVMKKKMETTNPKPYTLNPKPLLWV